MIDVSGVVALDGHDAAGKTTLARQLAKMVNGSYQRPFHGDLGAALLDAGLRGDAAEAMALGEEGIRSAIAAAGIVRPVVLDRGWMTVASLVDWPRLTARWRWWMPTALCWADLATTLVRLDGRDEEPEKRAWHEHYLAMYIALADRTKSYILRTDHHSEQRCSELLTGWLRRNPTPPRVG